MDIGRISVWTGAVLGVAACITLAARLDGRYRHASDAEAFEKAAQETMRATQRAIEGVADKSQWQYLQMRIRSLEAAYNYKPETMPAAVRTEYEMLRVEFEALTKELDKRR